MVSRVSKVHIFFLLVIISSGHLDKIRWSVCISKSQRSLCISFFRKDSGLFIWSKDSGLFMWSKDSGLFIWSKDSGLFIWSKDSGLFIWSKDSGLFIWSNFNFLHNSLWITVPTQSCLVLYSFYANLLHSLFMWLIVSSLSSHYLHLLFCCVLSILALRWLVLMALFWVAIRRDSVSHLRFPFLSHIQVFLC